MNDEDWSIYLLIDKKLLKDEIKYIQFILVVGFSHVSWNILFLINNQYLNYLTQISCMNHQNKYTF